MTPVGIGRSVSPIPIPKQIAVTSLDIDSPDHYPVLLLARPGLTKIDKFQIKAPRNFPFYTPLSGNADPEEFFEVLTRGKCWKTSSILFCRTRSRAAIIYPKEQKKNRHLNPVHRVSSI